MFWVKNSIFLWSEIQKHECKSLGLGIEQGFLYWVAWGYHGNEVIFVCFDRAVISDPVNTEAIM